MQSDRSIEVAYVTKALAFAAAVMVALLFVLADAKPAHAVTLTVNSTADPGTGGCNSTECTLREAINVSNGLPTTDTINFNIPDGPAPGLEVKTISPASALPTITDRVTIDGYTQAGAVVNNATTNANNAVLKIELSGRRPNGSRLAASGLSIQASSCLVKGLSINRFGQHGVLIKSASNTLEGNFIGIDPGGTLDRGNGRDGVRIESSDNLIGGPANAAQNIISGNDDNGVFVDGESTTASGNVISNNHIGTDADAEKDVGNSDNGVHVFFAPGVVVGGTGANGAGQDDGSNENGEGNIISGNNDNGVLIDNIGASGAKVLGNFIGLNRNGNGVLGNTLDGVRVSSAPQAEIGGTGSTFSNGQGNTISDNGQHGVEIVGSSSTFNKVLGNHIGTNFNGGSAFGNAGDGVRIGNASSTTIGGTSAGARNVISGNSRNGVFISGTNTATFNKVEGNYIGTDASGTGALGNNLGNAEVGVRVETPGNTVGGTAIGAGNVISDNGGTGVSILATDVSNATNNKIEGNLIGTDANGEGALGNFHGVFISDAPGNTVGGTDSAAANTISGNLNQGVMILGAAATGNSVLRNSIFANGSPGGLGIALNNDGVTANDNKDPDTGPNKLQNFPVITSASTTTVTGSLNSRPSKTFTIQFFSNPAPNFPTGFGEGETFLGEKTVTTNDRGRATFNFNTSVSAGQLVTATATDASGNTSEFSQALTVG
jgi:CSLREA domain-containing protein